ncbi:hypothetical protein SAMN02910339_00471 [Lachnospiraceae bacterium YSD2013]|nr:hypothetical protein SAMN02910339_00471 [Lachnospiraceae bacterium YSD2013]
MKIITFYLPQFHRIKENDEWWGEGFTEWTNVKKCKPVFKNQTQPKIPLDENYYDLMDKTTVEWQTDLMNQYGVYGFCYFHYWFKGRKILEKPAENLLKWKDINQRFCFAWANATWARTWSAVKGTEWTKSEEEREQIGDGVLLKQEYGNKEDWIRHYNYLREFFLDDRYIKKDGMPLFLIYKLHDIECAKDMFEVWNNLAKKDGFPGIFVVSINEVPNNTYVKAIAKYGNYSTYNRNYFRSGVNYIIRHLLGKKNAIPYILSYEKVWKGLIKEKYSKDILTFPGGVVKYDETPRRGRDSTYIEGATPERFEKYLTLQVGKRENTSADFLFLDAWNEWGEGNYLEPDVEFGYGYLEALKRVTSKYGN